MKEAIAKQIKLRHKEQNSSINWNKEDTTKRNRT